MDIKTPLVNGNWDNFNIKACLFDVDGTLIDTMSIYDEVISSELNRCGITFSDEDKKRIFSEILQNYLDKPPSKAFYLKLIYGIGRSSSLSRFKSIKFTRNVIKEMRLKTINVPLFPGVNEILDFLSKKNIRMGLVSMSSTKGILSRLEPYGIIHYFEIIIGRDQLKSQKPDPEGVLKASNSLGMKPINCIFVGDLPIDVEAGKRANMKTVGILNHALPDFLLESKPDLIVENFFELKNWLEHTLI